jgi:3-deoxy-7-phosphoheptulonate synthase
MSGSTVQTRRALARELGVFRSLHAAQQPSWPDPVALRRVVEELENSPSLVLATECDALRSGLAAVSRGEAFLLQGGDCAETFAGVTDTRIRGTYTTLQRMADVIGAATGLPVVTVGRIAGQYAKPRSQPVETYDGVTLPAFRGEAVNGAEFTAQARTPDPARLRRVYDASATTLNHLRAISNQARATTAADRPAAREFFTSHEALLLDYEAALTRLDTPGGAPYNLSGHMVWIGERTRQLDGAHVEFASRIRNPIGVKLGPLVTPDEVLGLVDRLDPEREPGRLTFITRMGADLVRDRLAPIVEKAAVSGAQVSWVCDPMHGNTFQAPSGHKTRRLESVADEIRGFFEVHRSLGVHPGGVHLELTGDEVTECVGGAVGIGLEDLPTRYETSCDPRLNRSQAEELAHRVAAMHRDI